MIKPFVLLFALIGVWCMGVVWHYHEPDARRTLPSLLTLTKVTKTTSPSLSVSYTASRFLLQKAPNPAYPQMPTLDKMDFIYAK